MITARRLFQFCTLGMAVKAPQRMSNPEIARQLSALKPIWFKETSIQNLADMLETNEAELTKTLRMLKGDLNLASIKSSEVEQLLPLFGSYLQNAQAEYRPPVVCIMGHVDHGKTTLLDNLRSSSVAAGEYGGITQKIGAFHVDSPLGRVTFIDTPGHEAFSNMRKRGAQYTDMIILVVSAVDGVQPQTLEVIEIARSLSIPIIVAINKIDVQGAQPEDIEEELSAHLALDTRSGNIPVVHISALTGQNVQMLLELILFQAELLELKATKNQPAQGVVLEARQAHFETDGGSTLIVQNGTLKVGDIIVVGDQYGKVRILKDDRGKHLNAALPSYAVEIIGLKEIPNAGEPFFVTSELLAQLIVKKRKQQKLVEQSSSAVYFEGNQGKIHFEDRREKRKFYANNSLLKEKYQEVQDMLMQEMEQAEDQDTIMRLSAQLAEHRQFTNEMINDEQNSFNLILKGQDYGTLETLRGLVEKTIRDYSAQSINIVDASIGDISVKDIKNAELFQCTILTLNSKIPNDLAKFKINVPIIQHQIIYALIEDLKKIISNVQSKNQQLVIGKGLIKNIFEIKVLKTTRKVYGVQVTSGNIAKANKLKVLRSGNTIYKDIEISNLKHFKNEVPVIDNGQECGICLSGTYEIRIGDEFESYKKE